MEPVFGAELAKAEKQKLADKLRARPYEYVAQEQVALSTAPVWDSGHIYSRSLVLRTYVLNTRQRLDGDAGRAGAGGGRGRFRWSRCSAADIARMPGCCRTRRWIRSACCARRDEPVELRRASSDLPSRVADNLFWLGRYAERAESVARLLRCITKRIGRAGPAEFACLFRLNACADSGDSTLAERPLPTHKDLESEIISMLTDEARGDSLISTLAEVHRVGGNVRERLSLDMTRLIGQLAEVLHMEENAA